MTAVELRKLVTLDEFKRLKPRQQGYVSYAQGELPGSPLKSHQYNPYIPGSHQHHQFGLGQLAAVVEAQEGDEG